MSFNTEQKFYENEEFWNPDRYDILETSRAELSWKWLPEDVTSLLDLGCGNGIFTNLTPDKICVVGADRAFAPLQWVHSSKIQCDACTLPFNSTQFDAIVCLEVLEHLPQNLFIQALEEICRVAERYILVSVPYCENRLAAQVKCPMCSCYFHLHYHMRSFDYQTIQHLFMNTNRPFKLLHAEGTFNVPKRMFTRSATLLKQWIPNISYPIYALCPQCGYQKSAMMDSRYQIQNQSNSLLAELKKGQGMIKKLWPKRYSPKWWLALYEVSQVLDR